MHFVDLRQCEVFSHLIRELSNLNKNDNYDYNHNNKCFIAFYGSVGT